MYRIGLTCFNCFYLWYLFPDIPYADIIQTLLIPISINTDICSRVG